MLAPTLGKGKTPGKPFVSVVKRLGQLAKKLCLHCCQPGHLSFDCDSK